MLTDLVQIQRLGEKKRDENLQFRKYLKTHDWVERKFRASADEIQDAIDCRQCGGCCRVTEVQLAERDVEHLAKFLRIKERSAAPPTTWLRMQAAYDLAQAMKNESKIKVQRQRVPAELRVD